MKTKQEIKKWLLKNCINWEGNLDLTDLDFSDFNGDIFISRMKVKRNLIQSSQKVSGSLIQNSQEVGRNLYQNCQKVKGDLNQNCQNVEGNLEQDNQKVKGTIFQDNITNADIDEKINALKEIISKLEKQKLEK